MEKLPATVPEVVGPYEIREPLGRGGMGEVFHGYDARLDRPVALKRVKPDKENREGASRRFRREARAAARLSHSSIVKLFDWLEEDGSYWIVMELVEGGSLREVLARGPLAPGDAARVGLEIAAGLAVAHDAGIVHRDIKPDNVMLTTHGEVKILDFGLAKQIGEGDGPMLSAVSASDVIVGTVSAMSPEQALGKPVDGRSDLFALGSLLFELVTGEHPFRGHSAVDTLTRICTAAPPWPAGGVPDGLRELIDGLLQKQPENRPQSAQQVIAALEALAAPRSGLHTALGAATSPARAAATSPAAGALTSTAMLSEEAVSAWPNLDATGALSEVPSESAGAAVAVSAAQTGGSEPPRKPVWSPVRRRRWSLGVIALACTAAIVASGLAFTGTSQPRSSGEAADGATEAELAGLSTQELYSQGMKLLRRPDKSGNLDRAVAMFEHAIARDDSSAPAHAGLARAHWHRYVINRDEPSWIERALDISQRAVELDPFLAAARISRGLAYYKSGRLDDAENDFREVLRLRPDDPEALFGMGCVHEARKDIEQALDLYRRSLTGEPDSLVVLNGLGQLLIRKGRYAEAEPVFQQTIEHWPESYMGYRNLSVVYYLQGNISKAAALAQKALEIKPTGSLYSNLGTYYFMQGYYLKATEAFERAMDMPHMANRHYAWGNLADAYRWTPGKKDKAKAAYGRAIELIRGELESKPGDLTLSTRLAVYLAKSGDTRGALEQLRSLEIPADDANAWYRAVSIHEICGQRQEALESLDKALRAGYSRKEIDSDPELLTLREDRRYHELLMRRTR